MKTINVYKSSRRAMRKSRQVTTNPWVVFIDKMDGYLAKGDQLIDNEGKVDQSLYGSRDSYYKYSEIAKYLD